MKQKTKWVTLVAVMTLLGVCASSAALTHATTPTTVGRPTQQVSESETQPNTDPDMPCPSGYARHVEEGMRFSACYPAGWPIAKSEDSDTATTRLSFLAPAGSLGAGLRFISVNLSPAISLDSEEDFLHHISHGLLQEYHSRLLSHPDFIEVDGRRAVDAGYEAPVVFGREVVELTRWLTVFQTEDEQWTLEVTGRSQYRDELEDIRGHFLAHFHLLRLE